MTEDDGKDSLVIYWVEPVQRVDQKAAVILRLLNKLGGRVAVFGRKTCARTNPINKTP